MCKNISISTASLKTRAQRFPEPEVISLYFISLGITFSQFSLWHSGLSFIDLLKFSLFMPLPVTAPRNSGNICLLLLCLTAGAVHSPLRKNENFTPFLSESQDGVLSPEQTVKNTGPQIAKIFYSVNLFLWSPHLQRFLSGRDLTFQWTSWEGPLPSAVWWWHTGDTAPRAGSAGSFTQNWQPSLSSAVLKPLLQTCVGTPWK